jgi:hypothetical protein
MEKELFQHLPVHRHGELAGQRLRVDALLRELQQKFLIVAVDCSHDLPDPEAGYELADHDFFGAVLEIDARRGDVVASFLAATAKQIGITRLGAEIELPEQNGLQVLAERASHAGGMMVSVSASIRSRVERAQVGRNTRLDAGPPHLHGNLLAVLQPGLIDA